MLTTVSDWRPMRQSDLGAVDEIAKIVHPAYPEDIAVATERLALFPQGCFIAEGEAGPLGYAISHPMILGRPAALDSLLGGLPTEADCLFLHDIALTARARGLGLGRLLIARLREVATRQGLARLPSFPSTIRKPTGRHRVSRHWRPMRRSPPSSQAMTTMTPIWRASSEQAPRASPAQAS